METELQICWHSSTSILLAVSFLTLSLRGSKLKINLVGRVVPTETRLFPTDGCGKRRRSASDPFLHWLLRGIVFSIIFWSGDDQIIYS